MIELHGVTMRYGGAEPALDGIDLKIPLGGVTLIAGGNGSGKSTLLKLLAGLLLPTSGRVHVLGEQPYRAPRAWRTRVGYAPQRPALDRDLSVWDVVDVHAALHGLRGHRRRERVSERLEAIGLGMYKHTPLAKLSGGLVQRASIAVATVHDPPLLFLDEPTTGLDPAATRDLLARLKEDSVGGRTIIMATHHLTSAETWADRVILLRKGRLVADGAPGDLIASLGVAAVVRLRAKLPPQASRAISAHVAWHIETEGEMRFGTRHPEDLFTALRRLVGDAEIIVGAPTLLDYYLRSEAPAKAEEPREERVLVG